MKILYVDLEYDYGIKSRGINIIGHDGFKKSFEALGHNVVMFYYDDYLNNTIPLQNDLKAFADETQPDLIFFSLFRDQFEPATLNYLKSKYTTVNWFGDDQWRFDGFTSRYAPHFTYCVTTDKFSIPKYHALGQSNVIYSQWAAIDSHAIPEFKGYRYDVSFVGGFHPYRKWFIDQLEKKGISVVAFGNGWPNGPLSSNGMNEVFVSSKINLNISNSTSFDIRYLFSSPRAILQSIRSAKTASQIKARNFEIPCFNGFQLTDYVPTLETYFEIGKEIACFGSIDEAVLLIQYYSYNDVERESIKSASHIRAKGSHTYTKRLENVLLQIRKGTGRDSEY